MCATSPTSSQAPREDQARVWRYARAGQGWTETPAVSLAIAKRKGANAVVVSQAVLERVDGAEGLAAPGQPGCRGHPRLRRDGQRQGQRAAVPPRPGHGLDRRADRLRHRLARGLRHRRRHPDHHPADPLRLQPDGLHHQPGQPVRPDLLDRHPGRRRHRHDREHRAALGDERRPQPRRRRRSKRWPRSAIRPSSPP